MKTKLIPLGVLATVFLLAFASVGRGASVSGSNTGNVTIPDAGGYVSSTIAISSAPAGSVVTSIDVYFKCTHTFSGDLTVDLNADSTGSLGNRNLWNREGGSADNPTRTTTGITTFNGLSVNRTWYLYAKDFVAGDSGYIDEWTITVYYSNPVTPTISSVSPAQPVATGSSQAFTVTGADFSGTATVDLEDVTTSEQFYNRTVSSRSGSTGITINPNFGTATVNHSWRVRVNNGATSSSWFNFTVVPPTVTPTISSVSPAQPVATGSAQSFTISGADFIATATVDLEDVTTSEQFYNRTVSSRSGSTGITINPNFGTATVNHSWRVRVNNGATSSSWFNFTVVPPTVTPTISSVSPAQPVATGAAQPFTITGADFIGTATVDLEDVTTSEQFYNRTVSSRSGSTGITINPNFGTATVNHSWRVRVNNGATPSSWFNFTVVPPAVTPTISSVSPAQPVATGSSQAFTVTGADFSGTATVDLEDVTTSEQFYNRTVSSRSGSTGITINPNFGTATVNHSWRVRVNNGATPSSWFNFTVVPPTVTPTISSVSPASPIGSNSSQPFTINGNNFVSGCTVTLRDLSTSEVFPNRAIGSFSSSQIVINPNFTTAAHNWSVEIINPGGASSGQFNFTVGAPAATPTITGVNPNPVTGSSSAQPFTILGNNFASGCNVTLRDLSAGQTFPNRAISSFSANQIVINPNFTTAAHNWSVEVINPNGASSGQYAFAVVAPGGGFYLSFPLANRTPYTATINSVFDHATGSGVVITFTGEKGEEQYGRLSQSDPSFKQANGNNFSVTGNGHYSGGGFPNYLSYDGHQGFDYRTRDADQDPVNGRVNVMAAAPGVVHWIAGSQYNTIEIDHGGGYTTRYLHLYSRQAGLDGVTVTRGQVVGISGDTGVTGSPHLHFEARLNGVAVDPYGWSGVGTDPYKTATGVESVNLWNEPQGCTYVVSPVSRSHGSGADSGTFSITAGTGCAWTATPNAAWITINSGGSGSGNGTVNYSVSANTGSARTGTINVQGTAFTVSQTGVVAGDRIYGVDVSSIGQGTITPSQWTQVKTSGKSFAWIRASKGNADSDGNCRFLDPKFYSNIGNAKAAGLIAGAYHVGNVIQHSAVEEAAFFVSVAGDYIKPGHLRPVLDLESHSCGDPASLGASALSTWVDQWATEVQRLTGVSPIIYCNQVFLVNLQSSLGQKYDLWVAKFTENPESAVAVAPWSDWTAFQYSQTGSVGGISPIDLNVFRGTLQEFQTRLVIPMPQITGVGGGGIQPPSNGQFQFEVSAPSQQQVILQASDDLATWTDVGAVIIVNGKATFTDSDANAHPKRFYRPKP